MTVRKQAAFENLILESLNELKDKVDESLKLGRENSEELKLLRKELGIDGTHGRLPVVEAAQLDHEKRIAALEVLKIETSARHKLLIAMLSIISGGAGGALMGILARIFGVK